MSEAHERGPCGPKFEDRTQEEALQQERCDRREAWDFEKHVHKLSNKDNTFVSPSEVWSLPALSLKKPEEGEFVAVSRASMHMLRKLRSEFSRTGHYSEVQKTYNVSRSQCEVQTHEEATVHVHYRFFDLFVTVHIFEDTLAVLSLGKTLPSMCLSSHHLITFGFSTPPHQR